MVNEGVFVYLNNLHPIFYVRPFGDELLRLTFVIYAKVANWRFSNRGYAFITEDPYIEKLRVHNMHGET